MAHTLRRLQRSDPMVQGSFYLLRRKCGKPNCRCARGQLHATYVLTRSEQGKDRLYTVPKDQRAEVRHWAAEYRRYQRARAVLVKRHLHLLSLVDRMADRLGAVIAVIVDLINPEVVAIGGGVSQAGPPLFGRLRAAVDRYALASHRRSLRILPAALGERAGTVGAGLVAWEDGGEERR